MVIDKNTYTTVKSMLESPDKENMVLGFECIENTDPKINLVYILVLFKETNLSSDLWYAHAPKITKILEGLCERKIIDFSITYTKIKELMEVYHASFESYEFYMEKYADHLKEYFNKNMGDFKIDTLTISITRSQNDLT